MNEETLCFDGEYLPTTDEFAWYFHPKKHRSVYLQFDVERPNYKMLHFNIKCYRYITGQFNRIWCHRQSSDVETVIA